MKHDQKRLGQESAEERQGDCGAETEMGSGGARPSTRAATRCSERLAPRKPAALFKRYVKKLRPEQSAQIACGG